MLFPHQVSIEELHIPERRLDPLLSIFDFQWNHLWEVLRIELITNLDSIKLKINLTSEDTLEGSEKFR